MDDATRRILDGTTWEEFCDTLKAAGAVVLGPDTPQTPFDRAEGFRYLSRLLRSALESFVENADPHAPELLRTAHETIKMGADNPDNHYQNAPISGKCEYRITGSRGTVHYLGFGTQAGNYGATGTLNTTGYLEAKDLELGPGGRFEILVSAERDPESACPNWLPMAPDSRTLVVRQTRLDHANEELAQIRIERIDGPNRPRPLDPERLDRGLVGSARFVRGCAGLFNGWADDWKQHVNTLPRFDPDKALAAGGDPNIAYYHSYWRLEPDEALVVDATPPECDYSNFQLSNHWLESLDYRYFPIHVNQHTAKLRPDGSVRVVVARENPEADPSDNWLDPCGHDFGTMCWRWIRAKEHPQPEARVVKVGALRAGRR
jgi:hypothetical protein